MTNKAGEHRGRKEKGMEKAWLTGRRGQDVADGLTNRATHGPEVRRIEKKRTETYRAGEQMNSWEDGKR